MVEKSKSTARNTRYVPLTDPEQHVPRGPAHSVRLLLLRSPRPGALERLDDCRRLRPHDLIPTHFHRLHPLAFVKRFVVRGS